MADLIKKIENVYYLQIGVQGENNANAIQMDMSSWIDEYPGANISLLFKPYNAIAPSPMVTQLDGNILTWYPSSGATAMQGVGYTEVRAIDQTTGMVKKSRIIPTSVENSVSGNETANPPAPYQDWVTSVLNAGEDAQDAKTAAETAQEGAEDAQEAAEAARDAAQAAAGDFQGLTATASGLPAGSSPTVNVTHNEGGLYNLAFGIPKGDKGDKGDTGDPAPSAEVTPAVNAYLAANFSNPSNPPLDRSLASNLSAAPADMVGDLKSAFSKTNNTQTVALSFEQGNVKNTGAESSDVTKIRTGYLFCPLGFTFEIPSGYKAFFRYFSSMESTSIVRSSDSWETGTVSHYFADVNYVRVVYANTSDSNIFPSSITNPVYMTLVSQTDKTLTIENVGADAKIVGEKIAPLYTDVITPLNTISVNGYWANGTFYSSTDAVGKKASVDGVSTVVLTGIFSQYYDYYDFLDASNNVIQQAYLRKTSSTKDVETKTVDVPTGAVYVATSAQTVAKLSGISVSKVENKPVSEINSERINVLSGRVGAIEDIIYRVPIAVETSEDHYSINSENGFVNKIVTNGSNNGLFNFDQLELNGSTYKTETDDITPVYISGDIANENVGYVGANHGYALMYDYTFNNGHGLTVADIGKIYTAPNGYKYVLVQVPSSTKLVIGFYASDLWYKIRPVLVNTTFDFGNGSITADSHSSAPVQLYPSVKNGVVRIVENSPECCKIEETYDIIDIGTGIEAIIANVGNNGNDSFCTLADVGLTVRNLYEFIPNGSVTVYQNLKICKDYIKLNRYGGIQSMAFTTGDYYSVPQTSANEPIAIPSDGATFGRETWDDQTIPPMLYMQFSGNPSTATKAFATGFITEGRNALLNSSAGSVSSAKKMYPALVQPVSVFSAGKVFNSVSFRVPFVPNEYSNQIKLVSYFKAYGDYYLIIMTAGAINTSVVLPDILCNRKAQVVMSDGIECGTVEIINSVDVKTAGVGYLVLKLIK